MFEWPSRRDYLRMLAAATGSGVVAATAGCAQLRTTGTATETTTDTSGPDTSPRDWLYDPTTYSEGQTSLAAAIQSPSRLAAASEHLHPDVPEGVVEVRFGATLPVEETTWSIRAGDPLLKGPSLFVCGGRFDAETAADNAGLFAGDADGSTIGSVGAYELQRFDEGSYGAFAPGVAVNAEAIDEPGFESLVEGVQDGDPGMTDAVDGAAAFVGELRLTTSTLLSMTVDDAGTWHGVGYDYDVEGAATRLRLVELRGDRSVDELRSTVETVDGLRAVDAGSEGEVRWAAATADTNRLAFDGRTFREGELAFDPP